MVPSRGGASATLGVRRHLGSEATPRPRSEFVANRWHLLVRGIAVSRSSTRRSHDERVPIGIEAVLEFPAW